MNEQFILRLNNLFTANMFNRQWINPLSKTMIATPKLSGERLARLKEQVKDIRKEIDLTLAAPAVKVNDSTDVMVRTRVLN